MKTKFNINVIIAMTFLILVFSLTIINFKEFKNIIVKKYENKYVNDINDSIEDSYRTSFKSRSTFINIYGLIQEVLDKKMIGNFEYIKDNEGFIHMFNGDIDTSEFNNELIKFNDKLNSKGIPFLYVQAPAKKIDNFTNFSEDIIYDTNKTMDQIIDNLKVNNIEYIDIRDKIANGEYPKEEVYFKTDIHMKTGTEFWIMQEITEYLENEFHLNFTNKNQVIDKNNYSIVNKKFLGNLGRSVGKYYTGLDDFELYYPNFETKFDVSNYTNGIIKSGEFQNSVMNGIESNDYTTYWVTDYLLWPSPYYNIANKNGGNNNILVIMDSMGLRTASYLSLLSSNLTILDTRYFFGINYLDSALENMNYDAVIMIQSNNLVNFKIFSKGLQAQIISEDTPSEIEFGEKYDIRIKVKNTSDESWSESNLIRLCIWVDGIDTGYHIKIPDGISIKPNEEYTFVLENIDISSFKSKFLEYQMLLEGRTYFGEKVRVDINVK